jgi:hypothetical protein
MIEARAMGDFALVTDEDLARARQDPAFRHKLLADSLDVLLTKLNRLRGAGSGANSAQTRQIRDGVDLAVKLADMLQVKPENGPSRAA